MHHVVLEGWSQKSSFLHSLDPRAKIALALLMLAVLNTAAGNGFEWLSAAYLVMLVAASAGAGLPLWGLAERAALVLPFSGVFAAIVWLSGDGRRAIEIGAKSYLSAGLLLLLAATTPLPSLLRGFASLGAPQFVLTVGQFVYRYLFVIAEQAQHMRLAMLCRGAKGVKGFRAAAGAIAVLFARSYERAFRIHRAMLARGFTGTLPVASPLEVSARDIWFATGIGLLVIGIRLGAGSWR